MRLTICFCLTALLACLVCTSVDAQTPAVPVAKSPAAARRTLALPPPRNDPANEPLAPRAGGLGSLVNTMGALALVIGLFLLVAWIFKRSGKQGTVGDAHQLVRVLASTPLGAGQTAQVIRFGNQLLLVSQSATQSQTLATITDADEIDRLCELCTETNNTSSNATTSLAGVFESFLRPNPRVSTSR